MPLLKVQHPNNRRFSGLVACCGVAAVWGTRCVRWGSIAGRPSTLARAAGVLGRLARRVSEVLAPASIFNFCGAHVCNAHSVTLSGAPVSPPPQCTWCIDFQFLRRTCLQCAFCDPLWCARFATTTVHLEPVAVLLAGMHSGARAAFVGAALLDAPARSLELPESSGDWHGE